MPVRFRPDLLKVALDSLFSYTPENFELIIVKEGNEEGVDEVLRNYKIKEIVYHLEPKGYPAAINAGYRKVSPEAKYVIFLNSDVVCTPNWLTEMIKTFELDEKIGIVAPTFSETGGAQNVDFNKNGHIYTWVDEVKGVCILLKKSIADEIVKDNIKNKVQGESILNEMYGMGGGDDNEICMICKLLGYKIIVSRKSFIYHYNSASFRELFNNDIPYSKKYSSSVFYKFKEKFKKELNHKPRIFVAIPCFDGFIHNELAIRLLQWSDDPEVSLTVKPYSHLAPLDNCRNQSVKDFLEDYWDYYLTIDNDIIPPPNCLRELLAANKDIIAPLCLTMRQDDDGIPAPMPVAHRYDAEGKYRPYYGKGVEETDVVTGGMHLVKRGVYEKIDRPYYFTYHANGTVIYSEDFTFSQEAKKIGYKLYTHYGLVCKHYRLCDVKNVNDLLSKIQNKR